MDFIENVGRRSKVGGDHGDFINVGELSLNGYERDVLYKQRKDGTFFDVGYLEGADRIEDGRGIATLDLDLDGDQDVVLEGFLADARLLVNHAPPESHWLRLKLVGTKSPRHPVGARVEVRTGVQRQFRELTTSAGYLTGVSPYLHFGLGLERTVDRLIIHWPSGRVDELRGLPGDDFYEIVEGSGSARPVFPRPRSAEPALVPTASGAER